METKTIKYTITFLSDWHAGSGLSSGAEADAVVIKDKNNLPFLPGKTIKGLLKDALIDILDVQPNETNKLTLNSLFGFEVIDQKTKKVLSTDAGTLFFSNAELSDIEKAEISNEMSGFLYRINASTAIGENGVAKDGFLRTMEVAIPLQLEGYLSSEVTLTEDQIDIIQKAMQWTRSIGSNRNRGLGRCQIQIQK